MTPIIRTSHARTVPPRSVRTFMPELRGHLCWDPDTAGRTVHTEAVKPSPAVFLATHAPLRIHKARIQGRSLVPMDSAVTERVVLDDFLNRKSDTGTLLMPIVGDSGSGKSHLVRWVRENIPQRDNYQVIYLEKSQTSLKAVVTALLEGVEDDSLAQLRSDVRSFSASLDDIGLARRLINALNEALATTTAKDLSGDARVLAGPKGLAVILQDPYIQEYMLAPGKFVPQLAYQLLHDRDLNAPERPAGFTTDDLPLKVQDIKQAAKISQGILQKLLSTPGLRSAAADLLNQHLETAVQSASKVGSGRLHEAMLQVREVFARQGKEIILLVEDFALIQGVQRELLEALTEAATREGQLRYAPMRTLMAVTTGYFRDLPETVMSRVSAATTGYVYDLDLVFSPEDDGTDQIASFVGRYLNAARVGDEELDSLGDRPVPNRCDTCPLKPQCHESFGHTDEGFGLYPFNRSALVRMVHSVAPADQEWAFVPRSVLSSVVRPILVDSSVEIREGSFPSRAFKERFRTALIDEPLSTAVAEAVNTYDPHTAERHKLMLEFWCDAPADPAHVDAGLLDAFGLRSIPGETEQVENPKRSSARTRTPGHPPAQADAIPESLSRRIKSVENWVARDQPLPQDVANDIRKIVSETVVRRYSWSLPLIKEMTADEVNKAWPAKSTVVSISGAAGENLVGVENAPITFERTARNSQFFQSLLRAKAGVGGTRAEDLRRLARIAESKSNALTAALERHFEISNAELVAGFRASLLGAALAGRAWPGMADDELLAAALDDGREWSRSDQQLRTPSWQQVLVRHLENRAPLVDKLRNSVGLSQGTGAVRMVDAARALPLVRLAAQTWTWSGHQPPPSWVKDAVAGFAGLDTCFDEQVGVLRASLSSVRQRLPRGVGYRETVEAVRAALKESEKVGLLPDRDKKTRLNDLLSRSDTAEWRTITMLEDDLEKISSAEDAESSILAKVRAAARDRGGSLELIRDCLVLADEWLTDALENAAARSDSMGDSAVQQLQSVQDEWAAFSGLGVNGSV
ncbi:protein DpdH [Nocardia sp. AB354]|uniref:protein DpdH n=1 Tax=Nocardia sp. AB354 TaxID=3413283 RepID=UPI003C169958